MTERLTVVHAVGPASGDSAKVGLEQVVTDDPAADGSAMFGIHHAADGWEMVSSAETAIGKAEMEASVGPGSGSPATMGMQLVTIENLSADGSELFIANRGADGGLPSGYPAKMGLEQVVTYDGAAGGSAMFGIHPAADGWEMVPSAEIAVGKVEIGKVEKKASVGPESGSPATMGCN